MGRFEGPWMPAFNDMLVLLTYLDQFPNGADRPSRLELTLRAFPYQVRKRVRVARWSSLPTEEKYYLQLYW
jgi:hypothetical protein